MWKRSNINSLKNMITNPISSWGNAFRGTIALESWSFSFSLFIQLVHCFCLVWFLNGRNLLTPFFILMYLCKFDHRAIYFFKADYWVGYYHAFCDMSDRSCYFCFIGCWFSLRFMTHLATVFDVIFIVLFLI